jgi:acetyl-CoA acetyltransferase
VASTPFGDQCERSQRSLAGLTLGTLAKDGDGTIGELLSRDLQSIWFGNCFMDAWGQNNVRGQVALAEAVDGGVIAGRVPTVNVEGACATGSLALHGAVKDIRSGDAEVSLAIAVEKLLMRDQDGQRDRARTLSLFEGCTDNLDRARLRACYSKIGEMIGHPWAAGRDHSLFMSTYAFQALLHMQRYGTTQEQIAVGAAKNHTYGSQNPLAQYRFGMTAAEVLADREVAYPLTRAMCAPVGDGGAAALVCSEDVLHGLPEAVRARAVRVRAATAAGGTYQRATDEPTLTNVAARRAYARAQLTPEQIDVAEVHDATSFGEILQAEMLGFAPEGEGGPFVASGATGPDGTIPVNTSGGLVSKGHPVGATGLSMIYELVTQLRGEAGTRQVAGARIALAENGGGVIGLEEAICAITILERAR